MQDDRAQVLAAQAESRSLHARGRATPPSPEKKLPPCSVEKKLLRPWVRVRSEGPPLLNPDGVPFEPRSNPVETEAEPIRHHSASIAFTRRARFQRI
eukprot:scaffold1298_cov333-Pavlova_lutheri.AAC.5